MGKARKTRKRKTDVRGLSYTGIFVAFMAIMAQISIPMPLGVPMTMQTFAVALAGILLGARRGFYAAAAYVLLGAVGVPVYSRFMGGLPALLGPTGGFILSFPALAWLSGLGAEKKGWRLICGIAAGVVVNYACGMLMFALITKSSLSAAFLACAAPFLPAEAIKMSLAGGVGVKVRERARKALGRDR